MDPDAAPQIGMMKFQILLMKKRDYPAAYAVAEKLAACVNVIPGLQSVYRWQGAGERAVETPLLIKTTRARYAEVEQSIRALHPYEVPEIIAMPVSAGLAAYLRWVADETQPVVFGTRGRVS